MQELEKELEELRKSYKYNKTSNNIAKLLLIIGELLIVFLFCVYIPIFYVVSKFVFAILIVGMLIIMAGYYFLIASIFDYNNRSMNEKGNLKDIQKLYKDKIIKQILFKTFSDVEYYPERGISKKKIRTFNLFEKVDSCKNDDYIIGKYKNIGFEMSDVKISKVDKNSEGESYYTTLFQGQWYIFEFNKVFKSELRVFDKKTNYFNNYKKEHSKELISFEDIEFNKMFDIYSLNDNEAFYFLTPKMIEKIKMLKNIINKKLILYFKDNMLHIGIENPKNILELSLNDNVNLTKEVKDIQDELNVIIDLVDNLNLDNDLFK